MNFGMTIQFECPEKGWY